MSRALLLADVVSGLWVILEEWKGDRVSFNKVKIAHLAGPNATIQNSSPLVTSNKARRKYGLPRGKMLTAAIRASTCCGPNALRRRRECMWNTFRRIR